MNSGQPLNNENPEADVVVIGGGGSGLAAAAAAAEKGARVILLEKKGAPGGNGIHVLGIFAAESPAQRRLSIDSPKDEFFKLFMNYSHWKVNPRIFRTFVDKSGDTIRWLEEKGLEFNDIPPMFFGYRYQTYHRIMHKRTGPEILKALHKNCQQLGVRLYFHSAAKKIVTKSDGAVTGVLVKTPKGELKISTKTVIIATGGYGGSQELLKKYRPSYSEDMIYTGLPHLTGDGLLMATEIGAATEGLGTLLLHTHFFKGSAFVNGLAQDPHTLWVNKNGERFADESLTFDPTECGNAIDRQPGKLVYALCDENLKNKLMEEGFLKTGPGWSLGVKVPNLDKELQSEIGKGTVKSARSWDEIAAWIGAKPEVLRATLDEYNSSCDRGHDTFLVKHQRFLQALRTPPFYAMRCYLWFLTTIGGIKINQDMEVLDKEDKPIPGLYAGGDTTGGWESDTYCILLSGHAFSFAVNSGRIAGENAAGYIFGKT